MTIANATGREEIHTRQNTLITGVETQKRKKMPRDDFKSNGKRDCLVIK